MEYILIGYIISSLIFGWAALLIRLSDDLISIWFTYKDIKESMEEDIFTKFGSIIVGILLIFWNLCMIPWIMLSFIFKIGKKAIIKDIKEIK